MIELRIYLREQAPLAWAKGSILELVIAKINLNILLQRLEKTYLVLLILAFDSKFHTFSFYEFAYVLHVLHSLLAIIVSNS